jgi:hypothetical protein
MRSETDTGSVNCPEMVQPPQTRLSGALLRRNGVESGPALLDFLAAAVRAEDFPFFVVDKGQDLGEEFLAIVAEEFVAGHTQPPRRAPSTYRGTLTPSSRRCLCRHHRHLLFRRLRLPLRLLPLALDEGGHPLSRGILDVFCSCPMVRLVLWLPPRQ